MEPQVTPTPEPIFVSSNVVATPKKVKLNLILSILLVISSVFVGFFYLQTQRLTDEIVNYQFANTNPDEEITETKTCVDKESLNCSNELELSFECTSEYQDWANENCPNWQGEESITCPDSRPEICTMECIENPPYICGSDGSSYCSTCQACSNTNIDWYVVRDTPCEEGFPL